MATYLTIPEIAAELATADQQFCNYCISLGDDAFFQQPGDKWSPAQHTKHLITATNMAGLAFRLPKFMVRLVGGKANRPSRTYDELVAKYKSKLQQGGKASGRYIPKAIPVSYGKEKLLTQFSKAMSRFTAAVSKTGDESLLDKYIAPHPLLGKITLRELCYFTVHHTCHHLESIKEMTASVC